MKPSTRMQTEPLQNPTDICKECPHRTLSLPERRLKCSRCMKIFKGDLLIINENKIKNLTPGRKPTRHKTHGATIKKLSEQGKTQMQIQEITGISVKTIRKILRGDYDEKIFEPDRVGRTLKH